MSWAEIAEWATVLIQLSMWLLVLPCTLVVSGILLTKLVKMWVEELS